MSEELSVADLTLVHSAARAAMARLFTRPEGGPCRRHGWEGVNGGLCPSCVNSAVGLAAALAYLGLDPDDTTPPLPDDTYYVIEVVPEDRREGRGRFFRPNGEGYTDSLERAGLFTKESDYWRPADVQAALGYRFVPAAPLYAVELAQAEAHVAVLRGLGERLAAPPAGARAPALVLGAAGLAGRVVVVPFDQIHAEGCVLDREHIGACQTTHSAGDGGRKP